MVTADSNTNNIVARSMERSVAGLLSFVVSKEEYQRILTWAHLENQNNGEPKGNCGGLRSVLLPNPNLLDSELFDDMLAFESRSTASQSPGNGDTKTEVHLHSVPRIVRSNTRFIIKAYLFILAIKNGRVLYQDRGVLKTLNGLSVVYGNGAKAALAVTGMSLSYKLVCRLLTTLKSYVSFIFDTMKDGKQSSVDFPIKLKTIIGLVSGVCSGACFYYFPADYARDIVAVYAVVKALEVLYNHLDKQGHFNFKPKAFGSWTLYPFAYAQLYHSFFFNPEVNVNSVNRLQTLSAKSFFPTIPLLASSGSWPTTEEFVDSMALYAKYGYPKFKAQVGQPGSAMPDFLEPVKSVLVRTHPLVDTTIGSLTHPFDPRLTRAYSGIMLRKFNSVGKYVLGFYVLRALLKVDKNEQGEPISRTEALVKAAINAVKLTSFIVLSTTTAHFAVEASEKYLSPKWIPENRFRLAGFIGGLWAFLDSSDGGHGRYLFAVRAAILSLWRTLVKEKKVKPIKHGDVYLFVASFAVIMSVFESSPDCISSSFLRKTFMWIKNDDFKDPVLTSV